MLERDYRSPRRRPQQAFQRRMGRNRVEAGPVFRTVGRREPARRDMRPASPAGRRARCR
ncbi:hypothetical protein BURMUCF2_0455, partial [Burkholderia multivorans CF2]